jgi:hypothetical protein
MHKYLISAASGFLILAVTTGPGWANWGCKAITTDDQYQGVSWDEPTQAQASSGAIRACMAGGGHGCHIYDCRNDVNYEAQADALWPSGHSNSRCYVGSDGVCQR